MTISSTADLQAIGSTQPPGSSKSTFTQLASLERTSSSVPAELMAEADPVGPTKRPRQRKAAHRSRVLSSILRTGSADARALQTPFFGSFVGSWSLSVFVLVSFFVKSPSRRSRKADESHWEIVKSQRSSPVTARQSLTRLVCSPSRRPDLLGAHGRRCPYGSPDGECSGGRDGEALMAPPLALPSAGAHEGVPSVLAGGDPRSVSGRTD